MAARWSQQLLLKNAFRLLNAEFPETWHLLCQSEDRCRSEHFLHLKRQAATDHSNGTAPTFNPKMHWDYVFRTAARDKVHWDRTVRDPARSFLARGGRVSSSKRSELPVPDVEGAKASKKARRMANKNDKIKSG